MSGLSQRRQRESDLDDDVVGFGDSSGRGLKRFDFGLSEGDDDDDDEVGEVGEDDEPSSFEDDSLDDEGAKDNLRETAGNKSGSFELDKEEPVKQKRDTRSTGGGDSYLSQKR
jgi:ATP-dependent RNA helicase MSS116